MVWWSGIINTTDQAPPNAITLKLHAFDPPVYNDGIKNVLAQPIEYQSTLLKCAWSLFYVMLVRIYDIQPKAYLQLSVTSMPDIFVLEYKTKINLLFYYISQNRAPLIFDMIGFQ